MSVINQMLKDLDNRQAEGSSEAEAEFVPPDKVSKNRISVLVVTGLLLISIVAISMWYFNSNTATKMTEKGNVEIASQKSLSELPVTAEVKQVDALDNQVHKNISDIKAPDKSAMDSAQVVVNESSSKSKGEVDYESSKAATPESVNTQANPIEEARQSETPTILSGDISPELAEAEKVIQQAQQVIAKAETSRPITKPVGLDSPDVQQPRQSLEIKKVPADASKLSETEYQQGLSAVQQGESEEAEQHFVKALKLLPKHIEARKRLAALWYGQNKLRDSVNLLRQGIAISPEEVSLRLLAARIYHKSQDFRKAYEYVAGLNPKVFDNVEYYAMRAVLAQKLSKHLQAKEAYEKILSVEGFHGKWWLGLAISLEALKSERNAKLAYQQALSKDNLTAASQQYAEQRITVLEAIQ